MLSVDMSLKIDLGSHLSISLRVCEDRGTTWNTTHNENVQWECAPILETDILDLELYLRIATSAYVN